MFWIFQPLLQINVFLTANHIVLIVEEKNKNLSCPLLRHKFPVGFYLRQPHDLLPTVSLRKETL